MATVQFKNVTKKYGTTPVISDFSLEIADGEFMVLVGPSGCGKSTTLRMLAGLESITSGEVLIDGRVMNDVQPKDRNVAMVFQNYALYPHMTVYDNLSFSLKLRKMSRNEIDHHVHETATILGIDELLHRKPRELSGGQSQRVALGRAIVRNPDVFLFDEPLSNLDAKLRTQMRTEIKRLHERLQSTVLYVTHDQTEAMTLGDRITILEKGVIQQTGDSKEVYRRPENIFVAGFIGSPQMNFFSVQSKTIDHGLHLSSLEFSIMVRSSHPTFVQDSLSNNGFIGVRAESFFFAEKSTAHDDENTIHVTAIVEVTENLGAEQFLYCRTTESREQFIARVSPDRKVAARDRITLSFNVGNMYFFTDGGDALLYPHD